MTPDVLGKLADGHSERDAVHIAIVPVVAKKGLSPGEWVSADGWPATAEHKAVGIVDPFLTEVVEEGERFWICLEPGSITSLRHEWTHPAFTPEESTKAVSTKWLEEFARRVSYTCSQLLALLDTHYCDKPDWISINGNWGHEAKAHWPELCHHYAVVSGNHINPGDEVTFSCTC